MKKYEMGYHDYAEAKREHQSIQTLQTIIYIDIFTSLRLKKVQSSAKQFKELFSPCPSHFR